ncbi:MAG TPA: hypothetical protein VGW10_15140 [Solirubrobacteraceae bacterium]|nr:hypothetical protein [Solirubrobacteraceae bacterium]
MIRAALVTSLALLAVAAPAQAAFDTCAFAGGVVTATFGAGTTGTLRVSGSAIQADGSNCQAATINNTQTIVVDGDDANEVLTLDLGGGPFAPGVVEGGEDATPEIEIFVDLEQNTGTVYAIVVLGAPGDDHIYGGRTGPSMSPVPQLNLNRVGTDHDSEVFTGGAGLHVDGRGGNDVLTDRGDPGFTGPIGGDMRLSGGPGNDNLTTLASFTRGGPGNDTFTFPFSSGSFRIGNVLYDEAAGPVTIQMPGGTAPGGDGDGGTDTFATVPLQVFGSDFADQFTGDAGNSYFGGRDGDDTMDGGGAQDYLGGDGGEDVLDGGGGDDVVEGGDDDDEVHGGEDDDSVAGGMGVDDVFGDGGDDLLNEHSTFPAGIPTGADDLRGGAGMDFVRYGQSTAQIFAFVDGRTAPVRVTLDDVADDGGTGEGDNARSDVEGAVGGLAGDTLIGNGGPNVLKGYDGADILRGGGGDDVLEGVGIVDTPSDDLDDDLRDLIDDEGDDIDGQAGADTIAADEGNDTIEAREGTADTIGCGPGTDGGRGDRVDSINADCEGIALPVEMPPDPPLAPEPPPPPAPLPPPPPPPPPPVVQPAPAVATLLSLPSSRRCVSRRKFTVRVRRAIRGTVRRVQIFINGRRAKTVTGSRIGLPIDLRGLPKGRIRVRLRVELTDGRVATDTRTYRTCATKKRRGQFGRRRGQTRFTFSAWIRSCAGVRRASGSFASGSASR